MGRHELCLSSGTIHITIQCWQHQLELHPFFQHLGAPSTLHSGVPPDLP